PAVLAAAPYLAVRGRASRRCSQFHRDPNRESMAAVRDSVAPGPLVGPTGDQGRAQPRDHPGVERSLAAQRGNARGPGRDEADAGAGALRLQLAVGDRHGLLRRRDPRWSGPGRAARAARAHLLAHSQTYEDRADRDLLPAGIGG